jgi:hypothetical protein
MISDKTIITFGKHIGKTAKRVYEYDKKYVNNILYINIYKDTNKNFKIYDLKIYFINKILNSKKCINCNVLKICICKDNIYFKEYHSK